jgi:chemotaxis protein methyltransferase CheR
MKDSPPANRLSQLSEFVAATMGLHFPRERWRDLECRTNSAAKEFGFSDADTFIQWLVTSSLTREQVETLASHLTIAETYFWREPRVFEALREQILPELIRSRQTGDRRLRIWSAGCATGEEPYSIAVALHKVLPGPEDWHITILATDINPRILRRAAAGVYGQWSFRNAPPWLKEGYFNCTEDGRLEILPEIRKMVTFAYLNLAEDIYPSPLNNTNAMDLIFCRNVLMYFTPERARRVSQNLYHSLVEGGWLIVGASELSHLLFSQFASAHFPGAIVYRKDRRESRPPAAFHLEAIAPQKALVQPPVESAVKVEQVAPPPQRHKSELVQAAESASPQQKADAEALDLCAEGHYAEVIERLEDEESPRAMALAVRALANQGKLCEALAACEKAIAADKLDPGLHYLRATILQESSREGEAIAALKRALYLDPNFVLAHFALGNLVLRQGNTRAAQKCFENVLALLSACRQDDILPESEGLTAGRFREIIQATMQAGALA